MNQSFEQFSAFVAGQSKAIPFTKELQKKRAVTISRQAGSGALQVAEKLAHCLQSKLPQLSGLTDFDRELMDKVLADHALPKHLAKFLPEDKMSQIEDILADIFRVRPTMETLLRHTAETLLQLTALGGVIIIGRAGNIITAKSKQVLHVRLVANLDDRIQRIILVDKKTEAEARTFCIEEDNARARYVKTHYHANIADPLAFHLIINTSKLSCDDSAHLITEAVLKLED